MGTISMPQGKGSIMHNRRDYEKMPEHIDQDRIKDNITLVDKDLGEAYHELFDGSLERYNQKQTRADRKKTDYLSEIENSKNGEKVFYEDIIQWGAMDDFKDEETRQKAIDCLKAYGETFEERNPNLKLVGFYIHNDEASPHAHFDYIPVAHGYTRGLDTRNSLDKALKEQGIQVGTRTRTKIDKATNKEIEFELLDEGQYNNATMVWKERERAFFGELCKARGLVVDQEQQGRGYNLSVNEYKLAREKMKAQILGELENQKDTLTNQVNGLMKVSEAFLDEERTEPIQISTNKGKKDYMPLPEAMRQSKDIIANAEQAAQDLLAKANRKFDTLIDERTAELDNLKQDIDLEADEYRERKFQAVDKQVEEKQSELDRVTTAYNNKAQSLTAADLELTRINTEATRQKGILDRLKNQCKAIAERLTNSFLQLRAVAETLIRNVITFTRAKVVSDLDERGLLKCPRDVAMNKVIAPYDIHQRYLKLTPDIEQDLIDKLMDNQEQTLAEQVKNRKFDTNNTDEGQGESFGGR